MADKEIWIAEDCPNCGSRSFVNTGDPMDQSVADVDAVECWCCTTVWWLLSHDELEDVNEEAWEAIERGMDPREAVLQFAECIETGRRMQEV